MIATATLSPPEERLFTDVLGYVGDPAGFISYIFPWEQPETALADAIGPESWHLEVCDYLTAHLGQSDPIRIAVASGHGTAKTTLLMQLLMWFLSTRPQAHVRVTAATANQLSTVTWRELAHWQELAYNAHWFRWTATRFYRRGFEKTWYASAIPWSVDKPQAFAGLHAKHLLLLMDEASTIADPVWEVCDGAMSTPGAIWIVVGNPEQPTGRFRDCFGRYRDLWQTWQIDARTARITNKAEIARQIAAYGEDSDFVRVRWRGLFPRQGPTQFISEALVEEARGRTPEGYEHMPKVLGVDVGGEGATGDATVLTLRQGVAILRQQDFHGLRPDQVADQVASWLLDDPDIAMAFIDGIGIGAGVVGDLHRMQLQDRVTAVISGGRGTELLPNSSIPKYYNMRAQIWGHMREWLEQGGCLPPDARQLADDLVAPQWGYAGERQIQLERKEDMAARGLASTDWGDSLSFSFARPVAPKSRPKKPLTHQFWPASRDGWMVR